MCHIDAFIEILIRRHKADFDIAFRGILVLYISVLHFPQQTADKSDKYTYQIHIISSSI